MRSDFYRSKEWRKLTEVLKLERLNKKGELICAYCGRPITAKYDAICHHKEHLTEENYQDANVALNPDNIDIVHHRCHNEIHGKGYGYTQEVYIIYGAPLSGKSTYALSVMREGDLIVDIDRIWTAVSGKENYTKPRELTSIVISIKDKLIDDIRVRRGRWQNAYVVGGYPHERERQRLGAELGAREIYIESKKEDCIKRLYDNPGGRDIEKWERYIKEWFDAYGNPPPQG